MEARAITAPVVLTADDIDRLPLVPLPAIGTGVSHRVLWEDGGSVGGLMRIRERGRIDRHAHEHASHDMWIVEGSCDVVDRHLGAGSYVHVPAGLDHDVVAGPGGCTLLYFYRRS